MKVYGLVSAAAFTAIFTALAVAEETEVKVQGSISTQGMSQTEYSKTSQVSMDEALRIARGKVRGTTLSVGLENEDGFLVYAVNIANHESGIHEVIIDAGNGEILAINSKGRHSMADDND